MIDADDIVPDPVVEAIDMSHATPGLLRALAEAQAKARTVGKDGHNKHAGYNYATAEAMIREGRRCREGTGLSLIMTSTITHAPPHKGEGKQWVCGTTTITWVLSHADDKAAGWIKGRAELDAIASGNRPNDKAFKAADTYLEGFIERDLFRLDRADESDAVDTRDDKDYRPPAEQQRKPRPAKAKSEKDDMPAFVRAGVKTWRTYKDECERKGVEPRPLANFLFEANGKPLDELAQQSKGASLPMRVWEKAQVLIVTAHAELPMDREPGDDYAAEQDMNGEGASAA